MAISQFRKHLKFKLMNYVRYFYWKNKLGKIGKNIYIDKSVDFMRFPGNIFIEDNVVIKEGTRICSCNSDAIIYIGKNTTIGYHNFIFASNKIIIGEDCLVAPFVYIVDSDHEFKKVLKINEQPNSTSPITIGDDVWIASNVTILKGVKIDNGAVIAANSVVKDNVSAYSIFGGTPAKKIGERY